MTVKEVKRKWVGALRICYPEELVECTYNVVLLGWMRHIRFLRGDKKHFTIISGWLRGRNHLPNGRMWGHFYVGLTVRGILLNYNHPSNKWYEKPIRDTVRLCSEDDTFIGRFRYLFIRGWFLLKHV